MTDEQIKMMLILKFSTIGHAYSKWLNRSDDELLEAGWTREEIDCINRMQKYDDMSGDYYG